MLEPTGEYDRPRYCCSSVCLKLEAMRATVRKMQAPRSDTQDGGSLPPVSAGCRAPIMSSPQERGGGECWPLRAPGQAGCADTHVSTRRGLNPGFTSCHTGVFHLSGF